MKQIDVIINHIKVEAREKEIRARKDYKAGIADCQAGQYDKWYRYNRADNGAAYDAGWQEANADIQLETVRFIGAEEII